MYREGKSVISQVSHQARAYPNFLSKSHTNYGVIILQASTSEMYGKVHEIPQTEKTPFYPRSPYGKNRLFLSLSKEINSFLRPLSNFAYLDMYVGNIILRYRTMTV